jgi:hypothetical protein
MPARGARRGILNLPRGANPQRQFLAPSYSTVSRRLNFLDLRNPHGARPQCLSSVGGPREVWRSQTPAGLEHDPEKWKPVFR